MKVSLNWLSDHLDLADHSTGQLDDLLTFAGVEVEGIETRGVTIDQLVVAEVLSSEKHPDADKLSVCQVDDGSGPDNPRQIVCGAKNYQVGDKVPLALPGCVLGENFEIKVGKLRGVESHGMLCAASEIGLAEVSDGLLILDPEAKPGTPVRELFDEDTIFDLEVTPNRPDCLSHLGIGRELAALTGKSLAGPSDLGLSETPTRTAAKNEIKISDPEACPFYTGRWIRGVTIAESPDWLKQRLEAIGLRPINNIVDITNYVLMEMGQPLHAFDLAKLEGGIHCRLAAEGEAFLALDGETYELASDDLVIADSRKAVAIGGVMGGEDTGVTDSTTDVLLEAAYFTPSHIRRTARRLHLHSDSSYRFERGVDPHQVVGASDLATQLILKLAGGTADEEIVLCGEPPARPEPVDLVNDRCRKVMGCPVSDDEIDAILSELGLVKTDDHAWSIPTYRLDLEREIDLIEEVARVFGLDNVPASTIARFVPTSKADRAYDFARTIRNQLAGYGFFETRNLKLISGLQLDDDRATSHRGMSPIRLKNPLNDEQDTLRPGLVPGLLATAERNVRQGNPNLRLFEMGRVFVATPKGAEIEHEHLALLITGDRAPRSWHDGKPVSLDLFDLRGALEAISPDLALSPAEDEDRLLCAATIEFRGGKKPVKLGLAGIIPPARARELGIESPIAVAELNLAKLANLLSEPIRFEELPRFPAMTRDIAMEVPADLASGDLDAFLETQCKERPLLAGFELFDVFSDTTGEKLARDKKSLAWSLTYRSGDRTLEAGEVDAEHAKILDSLKQGFPIDFR